MTAPQISALSVAAPRIQPVFALVRVPYGRASTCALHFAVAHHFTFSLSRRQLWFGQPSGGSTSPSRLLSRSGVSSRAEPCSGVLRPCPTSSFALGSNASSFAVEAISAPPASSMLAVPVGSGIPFHSDALKPGDSTSLALTFMTVHVGTKQTRALGLHRRNR